MICLDIYLILPHFKERMLFFFSKPGNAFLQMASSCVLQFKIVIISQPLLALGKLFEVDNSNDSSNDSFR